MSKFVIEGGHKLSGTITASGNKNAALKFIASCLLTDRPVILHNIPNIQDVGTMLELVADIGVDVSDLGSGSWRLHAADIKKTTLSRDLASRVRASFVLSGPMLGRTGHINLPIPGGDVIGGRPLDTHIQGLEALGASVSLDEKHGVFNLNAEELRGTGRFLQAEASVTATENTVMAAVLAKGETIIENAACEPHVRGIMPILD